MNSKTTLCAILLVLASLSSVCAQSRFTYSADGAQVNDSVTGLIWRRCVEGMTWAGNGCTGTPGTYSHNQAFAHAQAQVDWRLPNVKELSSIIDESRPGPTIDPVAFPGTPAEKFWSSTPQAGYPAFAWFVDFYQGLVSDYMSVARNSLGTRVVRVRLVRSSP